MRAGVQLAIILAGVVVAAGLTWLIKGPPDRSVACDPSRLPVDEVCLARVVNDWQQRVIWVDARPRDAWQRDGIAGALLWNLDPAENMQAFEAAAAARMLDGQRVVVYCDNENCGVSRQVAERIKALQLGNEVFVLHGGWRALAAAKLTKAP